MNTKRLLIFIKILFILSFFIPTLGAQEVLTWHDCLAQAKENNPALISSAEQVNQKKSGKDITASGLYPQTSATFGASTSETGSDSGSSETTNSYSYGINASQLIFDGQKSINSTKAAEEDVKAAQENYRFTSAQTRWNLRASFVKLLKAQELIKVAEDIEKIRRDNLVLITLRYQSGLEHKGALLTAEANVAQARLELAQAKRDVELAQRQLAKAMGAKEFKSFFVQGDFIVSDTAAQKPDLEALIKNNPSVLQAIAKRNAAMLNISASKGNFSPRISASAGAGRKSSDWPPENNQWSAGLNVNLPLFEGGLKQAQLDQSRASYRQAQADARIAEDTVLVNLQQAWGNLQDALERVGVEQKTLEASQERSKIAEAQYAIGFISFDNWIIIENDLVTAKKSYLQAQAAALLAEADWVLAKGETLEYAP